MKIGRREYVEKTFKNSDFFLKLFWDLFLLVFFPLFFSFHQNQGLISALGILSFTSLFSQDRQVHLLVYITCFLCYCLGAYEHIN